MLYCFNDSIQFWCFLSECISWMTIVNWVDFSVLGMILKSGDLMHLLIDRVLFNCCVHFTANITEPDDESEGKNINQSQFSLRSS